LPGKKKLNMSNKSCLKVVLFGPESTGKTTLGIHLAQHYKTKYVPEYARDYLQEKWDKHKDICSLEDLPIIVKGQKLLENNILKESNKIIFCDTNVVVTQIWSQTHFDGYCSPKILEAARKSRYDFYLLTDIDVPWQKDDLRDRPNDRKNTFKFFKETLDFYKFPYKKISGDISTRIKDSVKIIDKLLLRKNIFI